MVKNVTLARPEESKRLDGANIKILKIIQTLLNISNTILVINLLGTFSCQLQQMSASTYHLRKNMEALIIALKRPQFNGFINNTSHP